MISHQFGLRSMSGVVFMMDNSKMELNKAVKEVGEMKETGDFKKYISLFIKTLFNSVKLLLSTH